MVNDMKKCSTSFKIVDVLYILIIVLPLIAGIVLKVLFSPATEGVHISGALVFFTIKMPIMDLPITETQVNSWLIMVSIFGVCLYFSHGLNVKYPTKRQHLAEMAVETVDKLVAGNMGPYFDGFGAFVIAILMLSVFSSLSSLIGIYPPTSDLNVTAGWAILVFILITFYKSKAGPITYLKGFCDPVPVMFPLNVISEFASPVSMAFRHYGNVLSGSVISVLVATALQGISSLLLGWIPVVGDIPWLQIGLPAILSVYFDVFSGILQAYIFATLTMMYVGGGFPAEAYYALKKRREEKKKAKEAIKATQKN